MVVKAIVIAALISIIGASEVAGQRAQSRRDGYLVVHEELPPELASAIRRGRIRLGMTCAQVQASWGAPAGRYRDRAGREHWMYSRLPRLGLLKPYAHLHFEDDRLVSWKSTA